VIFGSKRGFHRSKGVVELRIDEAEARVLTGLLEQLGELITPAGAEASDPLAAMVGIDDDSVTPSDPALLRLFPDGYRDDQVAAAEFRRFTERGLREGKLARLDAVLAVLARLPEDSAKNPTRLDEAEQQAFLLTMNDLRLVLGTRLEIVEDNQDVGDDWDPHDPRIPLLAAYQWLTWLQSTLLESLS
jgi:Domain of unknown function (DUF2017)